DRHLDALFLKPLAAEEVPQHVGPIDPWEIVLVDHVRVPEAVPHLAELGLGSERQREERDAGLGELHTKFLAPRLLAGLDTNLCIRIRVHLAEERELDLAREEAVLLAGERPALGFLDVRLREVAHEIAGDPDVEEDLAGAALRVERERLVRTRQLGERHPRGRRCHGGGARGSGRQSGALTARGPANARVRQSASTSPTTGIASSWDAAVPSAAMRLRSCSSFQRPNSPEAWRCGRQAPDTTRTAMPSTRRSALSFVTTKNDTALRGGRKAIWPSTPRYRGRSAIPWGALPTGIARTWACDARSITLTRSAQR